MARGWAIAHPGFSRSVKRTYLNHSILPIIRTICIIGRIEQREQIEEFRISESFRQWSDNMIHFYIFSKTYPWEAKKVEYKYYSNFYIWAGKAYQIQILVISKSKQKSIDNNIRIRKNQSVELACSLILISLQGYQKAFLL